MSLVVGAIECNAAVFIYKDDDSGPTAWQDVQKINTDQGGIRGEWHTQKYPLLDALKTWNSAVDPTKAFLCIYAHMGNPGINCVKPKTSNIVSWQELADAMSQGVQYLWLLGCDSQKCLQTWLPLQSPVRRRLLVTSKSICWRPLLRVFASEISMDPIVFDEQMPDKIQQEEPMLAKYTHYFERTHSGFQPK